MTFADGKPRMLAVLLPQRIPIAPEVPTLVEAGVASVSWSAWQAIFAPPNTPSEIADRHRPSAISSKSPNR